MSTIVDLWQVYPSSWRMLLAGFFMTVALMAGVRMIAIQAGWLPELRDRYVHKVVKPRTGGLAMWLALIILLMVVLIKSSGSDLLSFSGNKLAGIDRSLWGILSGMFVVLIFGLWDDLRGLKPWQQLIGQCLAALCLIIFGVGVSYLSLPNGHVLLMDSIAWHLPALLGGWAIYPISSIFTLFWVIIMINVMNFFDGLDGLAGSITVTSGLVLFLVSMRVGFLGTGTLALLMAGIAGGFLIWNWYPSKILMGTVGSQLLGFMLAVIAIISGGKVATAVLVLGIPILDAMFVILRRIRAGQSPFKADQRHLHHRLLKLGFSVPVTVIIINVLAFGFGIMAIQTQSSSMKGWLLLGLLICMVLFLLFTYLLEKRKK